MNKTITSACITDLSKKMESDLFGNIARDAKVNLTAICVSGAMNATRKQIHDFTGAALNYFGANGGLAWIRISEVGDGKNGIHPNNPQIFDGLSDEDVNTILMRVNAVDGDLLFIGLVNTESLFM